MDPADNKESLLTVVEENSMSYEVDLTVIFPKIHSDEPPSMEVYYAEAASLTEAESNFVRLKDMFPNVDDNYIMKVCVDPPVSGSDDTFVLLINHLLTYEETIDVSLIGSNKEMIDEASIQSYELSEKLEMGEHAAIQDGIDEEKRNKQLLDELLKQKKLNEEARNELLFGNFLEQQAIKEKIEILENILPDANPEELREIVVQNSNDPEFLERFVESKLNDRNYEKRVDYYANLKSRMMIEQYTRKFDVVKFVKQFPEPIEHFESPNRQCFFQESAFNYLKKIYSIFDDQYLRKTYFDFNYNLSLTVKYIRSRQFEPNTNQNHEIKDIPLLQEIAFIENKLKIKQYLEAVKLKEEQELRVLSAKNLLLECQCCYDKVKPYDSIDCKNGHLFCKKCIIRGTNVVISNGEAIVRCFMGCDNEISLDILRKVLPENIFEVFLKKRQDVDVLAANISGLANCPFCPYLMELDPEIQLFMCKNPECKKISCRKCKKLNHLPIRCEDVLDEHKGRLFVEEEMSKGLIIQCYNCQKPFVKDDGCNIMECNFCRAKWCHICKQPVNGHNHFIFSSNCRNIEKGFDEQQVELKRNQAIKKIHQDFPDLKLPDI